MEALFSTFLEDKQLIDGIGSCQLRDYRSLFRAHVSEMSDLSQDSLRSLRLFISDETPIRQRGILRNVRSFVRSNRRCLFRSKDCAIGRTAFSMFLSRPYSVRGRNRICSCISGARFSRGMIWVVLAVAIPVQLSGGTEYLMLNAM